jgi:hypothetical protein
MDEKKLGLGIIAVMLISLIGTVYGGISQGAGSVMLFVFSLCIAFAILFFDDWFGAEKE